MKFFLGTHMTNWLADRRFKNVPLFVSRRRLAKVRSLPRAVGSWALDSGGFTELQMFGRWNVTPRDYAREVRRLKSEIGNMTWAAPQDWMCEPIVINGGKSTGGQFKGTGLTVAEHQRKTVDNFIELRSIAPDLPFIPVLQGWTLHDYVRCEDLYSKSGIDLSKEPIVGIGTMCRRQSTREAHIILTVMSSLGIPLHGFGYKLQGLEKSSYLLKSADSLAWSYAARLDSPLCGHTKPGPGRPLGHKNCANCADYALRWQLRVLKIMEDT